MTARLLPQILGNNECFEPYTSNIYVRRVLSGEFTVVNQHLLMDLTRLGLWNPDLKNELVAANGSVQVGCLFRKTQSGPWLHSRCVRMTTSRPAACSHVPWNKTRVSETGCKSACVHDGRPMSGGWFCMAGNCMAGTLSQGPRSQPRLSGAVCVLCGSAGAARAARSMASAHSPLCLAPAQDLDIPVDLKALQKTVWEIKHFKLCPAPAQDLDIPDDLKALYKTVWEIKQRVLVDMAADRGAFIDQSQSFNVHMSDPNFGKLTSLHFHAWRVRRQPDFRVYGLGFTTG